MQAKHASMVRKNRLDSSLPHIELYLPKRRLVIFFTLTNSIGRFHLIFMRHSFGLPS